MRCMQLRNANINASLSTIVKLVSMVPFNVRYRFTSPNTKVLYIRFLAGLQFVGSCHSPLKMYHILESSSMLNGVAPRIMSVNAGMMHHACRSPDDDLHIPLSGIKIGRIRWAKRLSDFIVPAKRLKSSIQKLPCIISEDSIGCATCCHTLFQTSCGIPSIRSGMAADYADVGVKE